MPNLFEQQARFVRTIFNPDEDVDTVLHATQGSSVHAGIAIYRNNVFSNYRRVLSSVYPVIQRLVGDGFFTVVCDDYIHATPSWSGDVRNYGDAFADFLNLHPSLADLIYLPDVARIEWACHQILSKPESDKFDVTQLAATPAAQLAQSRIELCATSALVSSPYPAVKIWQTNQPDYAGDGNVDLSAGAEYGLLLRENFSVTLHSLNAAEFEFLSQLSQHKTLAEALQAAQTVAAYFDLGGCLMRHIGNGAISTLSATGSSVNPTNS